MPFAQLPAAAPGPGPIIRVIRSTMTPDELRVFEPTFEAYVGRIAERWTANFALWWGTSHVDDGIEVALVSGWEGIGPLRRARAGMRDGRGRDDPVAAFERNGRSETWQLVDQTATSFEPAAGTVLRLLRLALVPDREAAFVDFWSPIRASFVETGDLAVSQVARMDGPEGPTWLLVNVWRDPVALGRLTAMDPYFGADLPDGLVRRPVEVETYDLRPSAILRLAPGGPAILITDDAGRIVDVTPAASAMLGAGAWDLLDQRLDDLVGQEAPARPWALAGRYRFRRPEGGTILLRAHGAANVPAPGRNAVLLVPGWEPEPDDNDLQRAIGAAYRRDVPSPADAASTFASMLRTRPGPLPDPGGSAG